MSDMAGNFRAKRWPRPGRARFRSTGLQQDQEKGKEQRKIGFAVMAVAGVVLLFSLLPVVPPHAQARPDLRRANAKAGDPLERRSVSFPHRTTAPATRSNRSPIGEKARRPRCRPQPNLGEKNEKNGYSCLLLLCWAALAVEAADKIDNDGERDQHRPGPGFALAGQGGRRKRQEIRGHGHCPGRRADHHHIADHPAPLREDLGGDHQGRDRSRPGSPARTTAPA